MTTFFLPLLSAITAAGLSALFTFLWIHLAPFFRLGQPIRADGPQAHHAKSGTPTAGGIAIFLAVLICAGVFVDFDPAILLFLFVTTGIFAVGFTDDFIKLTHRANDGLPGRYKMLGQIAVGLLFMSILIGYGHAQTVTGLLATLGFTHPILYGLFGTFLIVAASNAANLTDGLDGQLTGVTIPIFLVFAVIAFTTRHFDLGIIATISIGALGGFLAFNEHPAKVFLGDTGAFWIGSALAALAILLHQELLLALLAIVLIIETLSVMIQVVVFKLRGIRVFRMAPFHHHLELGGWSEVRIVKTFWLISLFAALLGWVLWARSH